MEKANSLIETEEEDNSDQLTGSGASSGPVPSGTQFSSGVASGMPSGMRGIAPGAPFHPSAHPSARPIKGVESGVFSGLSSQVTGEQLVDSLQSALSAASRGEAGLGSLHRSVRDASRALTSLRHAHESLGEELRVMYRGLNEVMSEKAAVERYAALLTQERDAALDAAEEARREAKRERDFLLREQDRFIQLLLEEHEAELQQLRRSLSGRSSAPPPVTIEPTTGFRIGVEMKGERPSRPSDLLLEAVEAADARLAEERPRPLVPMPRPEADTMRPGPNPLARLQLASVPSDLLEAEPHADNDPYFGDEPGTQRGIGERNSTLDRSLTERNLMDTMLSDTLRSEVPPADGERAGTYPPPPAVLDLDSLAAEVEGNSERPPPIRRIGSFEPPKLHLKPARVPSQFLDTLVSNTSDEDPDGKS